VIGVDWCGADTRDPQGQQSVGSNALRQGIADDYDPGHLAVPAMLGCLPHLVDTVRLPMQKNAASRCQMPPSSAIRRTDGPDVSVSESR
jgi:hypothetical protein